MSKFAQSELLFSVLQVSVLVGSPIWHFLSRNILIETFCKLRLCLILVCLGLKAALVYADSPLKCFKLRVLSHTIYHLCSSPNALWTLDFFCSVFLDKLKC